MVSGMKITVPKSSFESTMGAKIKCVAECRDGLEVMMRKIGV